LVIHTRECKGGTAHLAYFGGINYLDEYFL
jgi:hypothetical protein